MNDEMSSLKANDTYELIKLPEGRSAVGSRWVYQIKPGPNGEEKYKARFVAIGAILKSKISIIKKLLLPQQS